MAIVRHDSEVVANDLFKSLVGEENSTLPEINLFDDLYTIPWDLKHSVYKPVQKLTNKTITEGKVDGNGAFDVFMRGFQAQLEMERKANRITGAEYTKAYVALTQAAMMNAVQFVLGRDEAFWMAAKAQADAITARVNNELARLEAINRRAAFALTKLKLATEDSTYGRSEYELVNILPEQKDYVHEQMESQRAQTLDTRKDGQQRLISGKLVGLLGQQKELYAQQVESYKKDAKLKAAKVFMDSWVTQKTIDEGIPPSKYFQPMDETDSSTIAATAPALDKIFKEIRIDAMGGVDDGY